MNLIGKRSLIFSFIVFGLGLYLMAVLSGVFSKHSMVGNVETRLTVNTMKLELQEKYITNRSFVGRVEAKREVGAAFEIDGKVTRILIEEGAFVEKGQTLATLDIDILQSKRDELVATRDQAESDMSLALITLNRITEAHSLNATSDQQLDNAEKAYDAKQAVFNHVVSSIRSIDVQIDKSTLTAPFSGVVSHRFFDTGQILQAGSAVFNIIDLDSPEARFSISNEILGAIDHAELYTILIKNDAIPATVKSILPTREANTRAVDVIFALETSLDTIRRGDLAKITFSIPNYLSNFKIPLSAITEGNRGSWTTFIAKPSTKSNWKVTPQPITILHQTQDFAYVTGTLSHGDLLIANGIHRLVPELDVIARMFTAKPSEEL
ncbi:MAG: efflux RND transporter periplasmic adaptor subunit [Pseudomonadota bacterium]